MNLKQKAEEERKERIWKMILYVFGTICLIIFFFVCRFIGFAVHRFLLVRHVQSSVWQIAQLTSNIRVFYTVHQDEPIPSIQKMVEVGAVPLSIFDKGKIINPFGGQIVIEQAHSVTDKNGRIVTPAFKISYQDLTHEECVRLAVIDWGDKKQGLVAVAAGYKNEAGIDTALRDIDDSPQTKDTAEIENDYGQKVVIKTATRYKINVAKPGNTFSPTPFSEDAAYTACNCDKYSNCTFAIEYTLRGYAE